MLAALLAIALVTTAPAERLAEIRVQGNTLTSDADVVALTGVTPGDEVTPTFVDEVSKRLRSTGRFASVEVLKRYASIADPTQILLVVIVDEGRVSVRMEPDGTARAVRRRAPPLMFLPMFGASDGYGLTYGALIAAPDVLGPRTRLTVPLTWGGERRAGVELEKRTSAERLTRLRLGASFLRRDIEVTGGVDRRRQLWVRGEREVVQAVRVGVWSGVDAVSQSGLETRIARIGTDMSIDTRVDPMLSRRAIYVRTAVERLAVHDGPAPVRTLVDASGYVGGPGPSTIVIRAYRDGANSAVPSFLKVLRGRDDTLRGYRAGSAAGDSAAAGTLEVRLPLTAPLRRAKFGVRAFVDAAAVYDAGERLRAQHFERATGGGVWLTATVIRFAFDVAHGSNGATRAQVSSGLLF